MEYKLIINRFEKNPNYKAKRDPYRKAEPEYLEHKQALEVILTEEEFLAVKKAVIEVIK